ncbi:MAG: crossover junction endodeoxyribonuclease RuvC [Candidatus Peribacteraceae bacterium]|jgi:crossover junction endodeoxyribonuclease RuvC|nr:crossover junction endodeoxyribonuclease RuvC [Candidatus Peribacteraceae bacterium]
MIVLGIDPGLATTGLGLIESNERRELTVREWLTIATPTGLPLADRLEEIRFDLLRYLEEHKPDLAVVERLFFSTNVKTAFDVAQVRGVILLTLAEQGIACLEPNPLTLKSCITGDGHADKRQMQDMICRILNLKEIPKPDDAADALALAVFGALQQQGLGIGDRA